MAKRFTLLVEDVGQLAAALRQAGHEVHALGPDERLRITPTGVWESVCSDCIICETTCPVLKFDREHKYMTVNQVACKGCGVCVPACPTGALQQRNLRYGQAAAAVASALGKEPAPPNSCNSCVATGGEDVEVEGAVVKVLCSSRFDPGLALEALAGGCQGVLVVGCLREGANFAPNDPILARREREARELLDLLGLPNECLGVVRSAPAEAGFLEAVGSFLSGLEGRAS
jgi:coenzyme F420-reducing hydrogenase delta subunit/Pyruvate/2-oxoacid:ferredoxin oxidoreductase delta subunit